MTATWLLEVEGLSVRFAAGDGPGVFAVREVGLTLAAGQSLALVGESGCGKTVFALALMGLLPAHALTTGSIRWRGAELLTLAENERRAYRGRRLGLVGQEPAACLNPVLRVGEQVAEALRFHHHLSRSEAWARAVALLEEVRVPDAAVRARAFPHQLSGGLRQRVALAAALACEPDLLIADEPTTALDVTVQAEILSLLRRLQNRRRMALIFITHDLALVAGLADLVAVMYAGALVESGPAGEILAAPAHPYTRALLAAQPELWQTADSIPDLPGLPPDPSRLPAGCPFAGRCDRARPACRERVPARIPVGPDRWAACLAEVAGDLVTRRMLP